MHRPVYSPPRCRSGQSAFANGTGALAVLERTSWFPSRACGPVLRKSLRLTALFLAGGAGFEPAHRFRWPRLSKPAHYHSGNLPLAGSKGIEPSAFRLATVFKTVCAPCTLLPMAVFPACQVQRAGAAVCPACCALITCRRAGFHLPYPSQMRIWLETGAGGRTRTHNTLLTMQLIYQLIYTGQTGSPCVRPRSGTHRVPGDAPQGLLVWRRLPTDTSHCRHQRDTGLVANGCLG